MPRVKKLDLGMTALDELFMNDKERAENKLPKIFDIPLSEIDDFPGHPYRVLDDEDMQNLMESIRDRGVITPATEMRINDLIYKIIDDELDDMIYDCDELDEEFEKLYFAKRVLSLFQNNDMPIRAAVGLLDNVDIIKALYEDKDEYIGDSDSDIDIWNYVVEHGYRHYDEIVLPGECPEMVYLRIARCILEKGKYAYEE